MSEGMFSHVPAHFYIPCRDTLSMATRWACLGAGKISWDFFLAMRENLPRVDHEVTFTYIYINCVMQLSILGKITADDPLIFFLLLPENRL